MVKGRKSSYWFRRVVLIFCIITFVVFVLFRYQQQSTQQVPLNKKNEAEPSPTIQVQQPQLVESTEKVTLEAFMKQQSEVQLQRHQNILETCAKHPNLNKGGISSTTSEHLLVIDKYKLLYCHIPKAGCTNWKRTLMVMDGYRNRTEDITTVMAHAYFKDNKRLLSGYNQKEQKLRLKSYTKFVFARHPIERLLSAYGNKFATIDVFRGSQFYQKIAKYIMKKFRKDATPVQLKTGENITWVEWTSYLTQSGKITLNDHWQKFVELCSPCKINYDYIGKLDTVSDDSKYILTKLGAKKVPYPSKSVSRPTNSSQNFEHYMSQLSQENLQKLWEKYQLDFELFGYPKPQL